jgi:tight adherence protein B
MQWIAVALMAGGMLATLLLVVGVGRWYLIRRRVRRRTRRVLEIEAAAAVADADTRLGLRGRLATLTPAQRISLGVVIGALTIAAVATLRGDWVQGAGLAVVGLGGAGWLIQGERARRRRLLEAQLVPALRVIAAAAESGFSVQQALERVATESPAPICEEFARTVRLVDLGVSLESALAEMASRGGANFEFFAHIVAVQYRIGGNLADLLLSLARSIQERLQFEDEVRALTAQARYSGWVLAALPFVFVGLMVLISPSYVNTLIGTDGGRLMLTVGGALLGIGLLSIRFISRVHV